MIESPLRACRRHSWRTTAMVLGLGIALLLPAMLTVSGMVVGDAAEAFVLNHRPTVFLRGDASPETVETLAEEIRTWPQVGAVGVLKPADNLRLLEERLGSESVAGLKIEASMLPPSIEIEPSTTLAGHVDLVSSVAGLEARTEVDAVDVAHPAAVRALGLASGVAQLGIVMILLGLFAGWIITREYLKSLRRLESAQEDLLEMLGASPVSLARPSLVRGVVVGAISGLGSTLILGALTLALHGLLTSILGVVPSLVSVSPVILAPVFVGALLGFLAGLSVVRRTESSLQMAGMEPYFLGAR